MSDGKWETVGKSKTKAKAGKGSSSKGQQLDDFVKRSSPLYDVSNMKESPDSRTNEFSTKPGQRSPGRSQPKKKKKPVVESKYDYKTIEEALCSDPITSIDKQATLMKEKFPDQPHVWLKDVGMYLNTNLRCPDESVAQDGREFDFPLCKASKSLNSKLVKLFGNELADTVVPGMFQHFISSMLDCIARDIPAWGYKICVQVLAHSYPTLCCEDLEKQVDKIQTMKNVPKKCLSLLWAFGQVGVKDVRCGAKVWLQLMLPCLYMKNIASYSMDYIEALLDRTQGRFAPILSSAIQPERFMEIARWALDPPTTAPAKSSAIKERMRAIYPSFRAIAVSSNASKRQVFSHIIKTPCVEGAALRDELTNICIDCLQTDPHCFSLWRDLYTQNLPRTRLILSYVDQNWNSVVSKMPRTVFVDTVRAFRNTNSDAAARSDQLTSKPDFHEVRKLCEELSERLEDPRQQPNARSFRVVLLVLLAIVAAAAGFIVYDVTLHDGLWKESQTSKFLEANGVISAVDYVRMRFARFYDVASGFLQDHVPTYWNGVKDVLSPYVAEVSEKLWAASSYVWESTQPARSQLSDVVTIVLVRIQDALALIAQKALLVIDRLLEFLWPVATGFAEMTLQLYEWLGKLISGEVSWYSAQKAVARHATTLYNVTVETARRVLHAVSEYIAPDNPTSNSL